MTTRQKLAVRIAKAIDTLSVDEACEVILNALTALETQAEARGIEKEATRRDGIEHAIEQSIIDQHVTLAKEEARRSALESAIKLSDKIEMSEPDGGTREWMAFKHFRNTLRDSLTK
jgi:hypothetical protein